MTHYTWHVYENGSMTLINITRDSDESAAWVRNYESYGFETHTDHIAD
jgi:hypothetical protein